MGLLTRLIAPEYGEEKIGVHSFMAALAEYKRGAITGSQVVAAFELSASEATALNKFLSNLNTNKIDREKIHDVLLLGEDGLYSRAKVETELEL